MSIDKRIGFVLLSFGIAGILLSVFYESTVLAFIGLTLIFWGCLFVLVLPAKYIKNEIMDYLSVSSMYAIDQIIRDSDFRGKAIYIPVLRGSYLPHFIGLENEFVYIPRRNVKIEKAIEGAFIKRTKELRLIPPGLGLADLAEKKLGLNFSNLNLDSLIEILPTVMTHDLEMAEDVEISLEGSEVRTKIRKPVCENLCRELSKAQYLCPHVGCPLCSAIACILTRVTNKPVMIEGCSMKDNMETLYRIL